MYFYDDIRVRRRPNADRVRKYDYGTAGPNRIRRRTDDTVRDRAAAVNTENRTVGKRHKLSIIIAPDRPERVLEITAVLD